MKELKDDRYITRKLNYVIFVYIYIYIYIYVYIYIYDTYVEFLIFLCLQKIFLFFFFCCYFCRNFTSGLTALVTQEVRHNPNFIKIIWFLPDLKALNNRISEWAHFVNLATPLQRYLSFSASKPVFLRQDIS